MTTPIKITPENAGKELLDWAESIICNGLPQSHCSRAEWDEIVIKWRDAKHAAYPDGQATSPTKPEGAPSVMDELTEETERLGLYDAQPPAGVREAITTAIIEHTEQVPGVDARLSIIGAAKLRDRILTALAPFLRGEDARERPAPGYPPVPVGDGEGTQRQRAASPDAERMARTMWVEHIQDGTFAGGSEDAYNFNASEKGAEFLVIRKNDFTDLCARVEQRPLVLGHPATAEWCAAVDTHHAVTEQLLATAQRERDEARQALANAGLLAVSGLRTLAGKEKQA